MENCLYNEEWIDPDWDNPSRFHDWKNYVTNELKEEWAKLTPHQRYLIANMLQGRVADYEQ